MGQACLMQSVVVRAYFLCGVLALLPGSVLAQAFDPTSVEMIDLTHTYDETTIYWPTATKKFELHEDANGHTEGGWFYSAYSISTPEHGGTHMDAPFHFHETGQPADQVPLDRLIGDAFVINVATKAAEDPDYRLTVEDVTAFEARHGAITAGSVVIMRTGWSGRWPDVAAYLGADTPGRADNLHFPSFGEAAARLLIEKRKVAVIGVDTASIDYGQSTDFIVHRIAGSHNVAGLENLTNLDRLPPKGATLVALPMKIGGGSGAPVRVAALVPKTTEEDDSAMLPDGFVHLTDVAPTILIDAVYHKSNNFLGRPVAGYEAETCILTYPAAEALAGVQAQLEPEGLSLSVFDCFRPQRAVDDFMRWAEDLADQQMKATHYPNIDKSEIIPKGYVAISSSHTRGSTVDLTIIDMKTGDELDFGTMFDFFDPLAHTDNPVINGRARINRDMLVDLMEAAGFVNFPDEWWHFTLADEPHPDTYFDFPVR